MKSNDFYDKGYYAGLASEPRFDKVLKIADRLIGKRLLDIGCGDGTFTLLLKKTVKAEEVAGIEISKEASLLIKKKGIPIYQLDAGIDSFPFASNYFDIIYCGEIIEHVFNPDHLLDELYRVLKPEGTAIVTTPNLAGWPNRLALLFGYQPYPTAASPIHESVGKMLIGGDEGQWGHIRVFTARALKELLSIHHFKLLKLMGCPISIKTPSSKIVSNIVLILDRSMSIFPSLANRVIAVVKKE